MKFTRSEAFAKKAMQLIPGGAHTYSKGCDQFPALAPGFIERGQGALVWDVDGNEFIDWGMGLRSVCLGHAHPAVLEAVTAMLQKGVNFTRPSPIEAEVAELITELVPSAEMVKFAKNGSDATTAAVKLARAYTGRDLVVRCADQPFFSVDDWFIGSTVVDAGIPAPVKALTKQFPYNDADALEAMIQAHPNQIACVILEAAATSAPAPGFLERVRELTEKAGIVLIFDEIITGFRWHVGGAQTYYNVTPDLSTFGKAMANGFSCAALVGKKDILNLGGLTHDKARVFLLSTTNGGETHSLAAAKKTIELLRDGQLIGENWEIGSRFMHEFNTMMSDEGLEAYIQMQGVAISPYIVTKNSQNQVDMALRTLFLQETIQQGLLIPYISICASHRQTQLDDTLAKIHASLPKVKQAIDQGSTEGLLVGPVCKPVFRKFN